MIRIIALSILFLATGFAQFSLSTKLMSTYDDNVNNNVLQLKSHITSLDMRTGYELMQTSSSLDFYYQGTYNDYTQLPEHTNQFHSGNIEYRKDYGEDEQNQFMIGLNAGTGLGRDSYSVFDHSALSAFGSIRFFINERIINQYGYTFRNVALPQLSDLSFSEHAMYAHAAFALSQKTTLIFQTDLGLKKYSTPLVTSTKSRTAFVPDIAQLSGMLKIGQNITESSGLSFLTKYQWNLLKKARYLSSDYGLISDDELFDDHYGYEGSFNTLTLTKIFSESLTSKLTAGYQTKIYSTLPAYNLDGVFTASERNDNRSFISLQFNKDFSDYGFTLQAAVDYIRNRSNDAYYNYSNFAASVNILFEIF